MRSLLLLALLLPACLPTDGTNPFGPQEEEPTPELPTFDRDALDIDATFEVDGAAVAVDWQLSYYYDSDRDAVNCVQRVHIEGVLAAAPGSCPNCSSRAAFVESSPDDRSEPLQRAEDCDSLLLAATYSDFGGYLLTAPGEGGYGDLLDLGFVSAADHASQGGTLDADGDFTAGVLSQYAQSRNLVYEGLLALQVRANSMADGIDLAGVTGDAAGGDWSPFFLLFRDPAVNAGEDGLQGTYLAESYLRIGLLPVQ